MISYLEDLISNYEIENPMNKLTYQVVSYIKNSHDYNNAIKMILDNNLKLEDIVGRTNRLKFNEVVELADRLIYFKSNGIKKEIE